MAYRDEVLTDTPAVYLEYQESTNGATAADSSGNSRDATRIGAATTLGNSGIMSGYSYSAAFQGVTNQDYWYTNGNASDTNLDVGTGDYAYEFVCICTNGTGNFVEVASRDSGATGNGQIVYLNTGTGAIRAWCGGTALNGSVRVSDSAFHHVVVTRESGTLKIYVDGVLDASVSATGSTDSPTRPLRIGAVQNTSLPGFGGNMAHFAYYKHALSSIRVAAHYNATIGDINADFTAAWSGWTATAATDVTVTTELTATWSGWTATMLADPLPPRFTAAWSGWTATGSFFSGTGLPAAGFFAPARQTRNLAAVSATSPASTPVRAFSATPGVTYYATILDPTGAIVDLTDFTVTFRMADAFRTTLTAACTVVSAALGRVSFTFPASAAEGVATGRFVLTATDFRASYPSEALTIEVA